MYHELPHLYNFMQWLEFYPMNHILQLPVKWHLRALHFNISAVYSEKLTANQISIGIQPRFQQIIQHFLTGARHNAVSVLYGCEWSLIALWARTHLGVNSWGSAWSCDGGGSSGWCTNRRYWHNSIVVLQLHCYFLQHKHVLFSLWNTLYNITKPHIITFKFIRKNTVRKVAALDGRTLGGFFSNNRCTSQMLLNISSCAHATRTKNNWLLFQVRRPISMIPFRNWGNSVNLEN